MSKAKYCCICKGKMGKTPHIQVGKRYICAGCEEQITLDAWDLVDSNIMDEMKNPDELDLSQLAWVFEDYDSEKVSYWVMCLTISNALVWNYLRTMNCALTIAVDKLNELQEIIDSK